MSRLFPAGLGTDEYAKVKDELAAVIDSLRRQQAEMAPEDFKDFLSGIELDEAAARDFLASDGSVEGMTDRMWVYFESPLKPRPVSSA